MLDKLLENPRLEDFRGLIKAEDSLLIEELWDSPKAALASIAAEASGKHVVIISGGARENRLFDDLPFFHSGDILEFPAWETLPSEDIPPSPDIVGKRYEILRYLQTTPVPCILLTSLQAVLQKVLSQDRLQKFHLEIKKGGKYPFHQLPERLTEMGYYRKQVASEKGEFAVRGGILDIFPVSSTDPYRIEFMGDEIESIRTYDPISQLSVAKVNEILITPGEELELLHKQPELKTLFDYLGPDAIIVFDDLLALEDKYVTLQKMSGTFSHSFLTMAQLLEIVEPLQKIYLTASPIEEMSEIQVVEKSHKSFYSATATFHKIAFEAFSAKLVAKRWRHPFVPPSTTFCPPSVALSDLSSDDFLKSMLTFSIDLYFLCDTESEESVLKTKIANQEEVQARLHFQKGYLSSGFFLDKPPFAVIPMPELTHRYKIRRQKQRTYHSTLPIELLAITPGEAVVHMNSGIGRFLGIEKRPNHIGVETEFLLIEYAEGAKLYVPIEQANLVSKYIGATDEAPKFHTLGSNRWKVVREKTEAAIIGYAKDLLHMQAERAMKGGFVYSPDSDLTKQFSEEFPYEETPDQLDAITKIYDDMMSTRSMDRLVCGDVGYGKTEVAMRAAFKAVVDGGKQVAILVPTTVLAMQHFETFSNRMANFPIRIGVLSRFRTPKQIKETLESVERGDIDILVGTHRILSSDVIFKDLGLIIIDEEQRFGVRAKEALKKLKAEVDCITLTATPIPRTLYMSLVGARELSVINTPPEDRLPIQTIVCHTTDEIIQNALLRELTRDGQAYIIHNRVETIFKMAERIQTLLPSARIVVGHGQMSADELDHVFHTFKTGMADILIATSIIENGIDIPNANTILVDRADRFGLADLYQIRGRVGRWNKKAYCYFLVPSTKELSEVSRKRLTALSQSSGHGGGMKIAMHDLELRGAGNILGTEQSGHVASVGFHLYCKLLKKTILALQKKTTPLQHTDVKIEFPYDARLPEDYVNEMTLRMEIYQRLGDVETEEEIESIFNEIKDRFGPFPSQVKWLYHVTKVRLFAAKHHFTLLKMTKVVFMAEQSHGKKEKISKKLLLQLPKTPEEFEQKVIETLKNNFPLRGK